MSEKAAIFEDILHESTPEIADLAWKIRALILEVAPDDAAEVISLKDRVAAYGSGSTARSQLVYIALPKDWARLGFYFGSDLLDPDHLLEGDGKRLRHIKIRAAQELDRPAVRELVRLAMTRGS
jgi:hypothetical protein